MNLDDLEQQYGLPKGLLSAVMQTESGGNPNAVSPKGATGLFQFMPATAKQYGVDPTNPDSSAEGAAKYYRDLLAQNGGDLNKALAAYNWGPGNLAKYGMDKAPPETQNYVKKVTAKMGDPMDWLEANAPAKQSAPDPMAWLEANAPKQDVPQGMDAAMIAAGKTFTRLGQGVQQAYYGATGNKAAQDALAAKVADEERLYKPLQQANPVTAAVGESLPEVALGPLSLAGAGALEYGTPEEKATRAAAGFVGGKLGQYGGQLIGRVLQPVRGAGEDAVNATKALLDKYNIQGLPGQITGSAPVQWLEQTLAKLPGGGRVRDIVQGQQQGLNSAVMNAMGGTGSAVTPEAVQAAKAGFGKTFDSAVAPVTVQIDRNAAQDLMGVESNYYKNLSPDQRGIVRQYVDDILSHADSGMPGDVYQKARSRIAARAASTQDSELKQALTGVYKALDGAFDRSAGDEAAGAMQAARGQYRVAKTLEPLANVTGDISPARLATAAKTLPGDLAQLGQTMKGLPDSGTAQRLFYQSLLSGGMGAGAGVATGDPTQALKWGAGTAAAQMAVPWLAAQLMTRAPLKNYLTSGLVNVSPRAEDWLMRLGASGGGLLGLGSSR